MSHEKVEVFAALLSFGTRVDRYQYCTALTSYNVTNISWVQTNYLLLQVKNNMF